MNNSRYLYETSLYDETVSILFGRLCQEKYISGFGFDKQVEGFEIVIINNILFYLKRIPPKLKEYIKKMKH